MKILALAGGTGSAKLLQGLKRSRGRFTVIANVGDNYWLHALYICPDLDTTMYTLGGIADPARGWGIRRDTYRVLRRLGEIGGETWFNIGDMDLATHLRRTEELKRGLSLTAVTAKLSKMLGVEQTILPPTDDPLETHLLTDSGRMHLQEFWVRERGEPKVAGVEYQGAETARPTSEVLDAIREAERIVICPANPVTSIMPILAVKGLREALEKARGRRVAVSPMVGSAPFSGPAGKLMRAIGRDPTSASVARLYERVIDCIIIDRRDKAECGEIQGKGVTCVTARTLMKTQRDEERLAELALVV